MKNFIFNHIHFIGFLGFLGIFGFLKDNNGNYNYVLCGLFSLFSFFWFGKLIPVLEDERLEENIEQVRVFFLKIFSIFFTLIIIFVILNSIYFHIKYVNMDFLTLATMISFSATMNIVAYKLYVLDSK